MELRTITAEEIPQFMRDANTAFAESMDDAAIARDTPTIEVDRTWVIADGGRFAATGNLFSCTLTVPGGDLAVGAVSWIAVQPTHRRRGLLTRLMHHMLRTMHDEGEAVAGLWASEFPIYGRFGFGPTAPMATLEVRGLTRADAQGPPPEGIALVQGEGVGAAILPAWHAVRAVRPAAMDPLREEFRVAMWYDPEDDRDGWTQFNAAILPGARGAVIYRQKPDEDGWLPDGKIKVELMLAPDGQAEAELWRFLLGLDLMTTMTSDNVSPDIVLPHLLGNPRRVSLRAIDGMWLRLIRLAEVLPARTFSCDDGLVLAVRDEVLPENDGTWLLDAGPGGATCERTTREPDLTLDTSTLAAVWLGGNRATTLARAGAIQQHTAGALLRADRLFLTDVLPWCPLDF